MLEENKLNPSSGALAKLAKTKGLSPELYVQGGMTITVGTFLQDFGRTFASAASIQNEKQMQAALTAIKEVGYQLPPILRKAMKQVASSLPRRGGPGRQPKLNPREAVLVCDQIATFIRRKNTLKQALQKVSESAPQLLGKKVSPRTLQKAWDKRE